MNLEIVVGPAEAGLRLDTFLANRVSALSRTQAQKLIESGAVQLNRAACLDKNHRLQQGDLVFTQVPGAKTFIPQPEAIPLDVVYEDRDLLVINKPRGMVVHPAPGHAGGTLVNALLHHCSNLSGIGGMLRPGIVHRLDKDTTGLLVVAKNDFAHRALSGELKERRLLREYLALVHGRVSPTAGRVSAPIGRHPRFRKKMAVVPGGREALTRYRVLAYLDAFTLLQLNLQTGRTHQVRVHLAFLGYPVVGDPVYGGKRAGLPPELCRGQALHARRLIFTHPSTGRRMAFSAPLPEDFRGILRKLRSGE